MLGLSAIAALPLGDARGVPYVMSVTHGTYTLSMQGAAKLITDIYPSGTFAVSGNAVTLSAQRPFTIDAGTFAVSGQDVGLDYGFGIVVDSASYTLTGQDIVFDTGFGIVVDSGSYAITGQDISIHISMNAINGSFIVTGQNIPKGISEAFDVGLFTLTERDADFTVQRVLASANGTYSVTGHDLKFRGFFTPYTPPEAWVTATDVDPEIWTEVA